MTTVVKIYLDERSDTYSVEDAKTGMRGATGNKYMVAIRCNG